MQADGGAVADALGRRRTPTAAPAGDRSAARSGQAARPRALSAPPPAATAPQASPATASPPLTSRQNSGRCRGERRRTRAASGMATSDIPRNRIVIGPISVRGGLHGAQGGQAQDEADAVGAQLERGAGGGALQQVTGPEVALPRHPLPCARQLGHDPRLQRPDGGGDRRRQRPRRRRTRTRPRGRSLSRKRAGSSVTAQIVSLRKAWLPRPSAKNEYRQLSCSISPGSVSPRARKAAWPRRSAPRPPRARRRR